MTGGIRHSRVLGTTLSPTFLSSFLPSSLPPFLSIYLSPPFFVTSLPKALLHASLCLFTINTFEADEHRWSLIHTDTFQLHRSPQPTVPCALYMFHNHIDRQHGPNAESWAELKYSYLLESKKSNHAAEVHGVLTPLLYLNPVAAPCRKPEHHKRSLNLKWNLLHTWLNSSDPFYKLLMPQIFQDVWSHKGNTILSIIVIV